MLETKRIRRISSVIILGLLWTINASAFAADSTIVKNYDWGQIKISLNYDNPKDNTQYHGTANLMDNKGGIVNAIKISGCTFGGKIPSLKSYLTERDVLKIVPIQKNAVVISVLSGCGAQNYWNVYAITDKCTASAAKMINLPEIKDNIIPYNIYYGYGARREAVPMSLVVGIDNHIKVQPPKIATLKDNAIAAALAAKHMLDFGYVSENFSEQSFNDDERIQYLRQEAKYTADSPANFNSETYIDDTYGIPLNYMGLKDFIQTLPKATDHGATVNCAWKQNK